MHIIRVELFEKDGEKADYNQLHQLLARNSVQRTIQDDEGSYFWLPPATYIFHKDANTATLTARVNRIVKSFWRDSSVLVIPAAEAHWFDLKPATKSTPAAKLR